jgi:hypothetical protein
MFQNISNTHDYTNSQDFIHIHHITNVFKFYTFSEYLKFPNIHILHTLHLLKLSKTQNAFIIILLIICSILISLSYHGVLYSLLFKIFSLFLFIEIWVTCGG